MILCHLKNETPDTSDYSAAQIDYAETCLIKYFDWEKGHTLQPIYTEVPIVSEQWRFGGTVDWFGLIDGTATLLDFKTGKGIYPEMAYQLAAYSHLITEHNVAPLSHQILRVGRDDEEGFEIKTFTTLSRQWEIFKHCLALYRLQRGGY